MPAVPYRAIAESTYDWETWIDAKGAVRWINPAVERLTGRSVQDCLRMRDFPLALVHEDDRARIADVLASGARGEAGNDVEFRLVRGDGAWRWVAISWQPLRDETGVAHGFRTSVRDIDERKSAEERLRDAERRATELAHAQAELLATLSHELRSPLHCISGFSELLGRESLPAEPSRYVTLVREQSDAALRLVEDLLHFVALSQSPAALREASFDLAGVVSHEVDAMRPRARVPLRCHIEPSALGAFLGDADRVRQVVANLVSNAVRFTAEGAIDVSLCATDAVVIEVRDTGIGMPQGLLERVREPFVQGAPSTASRGGVGLGLAIVERLVHAMGGVLAITSAPSQGTTARVSLPLERSATGPRDEAAEHTFDPRALAGLRVLVVDDSLPARELCSAMLHTLGAEVDLAESGLAAIERVRASAYDIVLLDYHMPELDGLQTAAALRAIAPDTQRVLLTANVLAEAFRDPRAHGIDRVLAKPMRLAQLAALASDAPRTPTSAPTGDVDLDVARELCAVRAADGTTLLARTLPRVSTFLREVLEHVRAGTSSRNEVHSLKGLVASVGASGAARHAAELETVVGVDAATARACADALEHAYAEAHAELERLARA